MLRHFICSRAAILLLIAISFASIAAHAASRHDQRPEQTLQSGQRIASAIATVTGTAMSPLLGICVLGAYHYLRTPEADRHSLPFYASPIFWIPVALLLLLVFLKDTVGSVIPLLKKPLDAVEVLLVNKAALLFAVLPVVWHEASSLYQATPAAIAPVAYLADLATGPGSRHTTVAFLIGSAIAFVVWLAGHALDVLALLSPIPLLDLILKGIRVAIFAAISILTAINVSAGLVLALAVIAVCAIAFWWAFRLALFGGLFAWDLLRSYLFRLRIDSVGSDGVFGFTAYRLGRLRKRSFGRLRLAEDGSLEFHHRPFGFGFSRVVHLSDPGQYEVGRGLFFPCVIVPAKEGRGYRFVVRLLPRYTGREEEIRCALHLARVRDLRVPSEFKAAWEWFSRMMTGQNVA